MPETILGAGGQDGSGVQGPVTSVPDSSDNQGLSELVDDIQHLIGQGHSDKAIAEELEMTSENAVKAVAYIRDRGVDFLLD